MLLLKEIKEKLQQNKKSLFLRYAIKKLAILGSVSREEQTPDSDVDLLVEFKHPIGIRFVDLADKLELLLGTKVDLVSKNGIKPKYFKQIKTDLQYV